MEIRKLLSILFMSTIVLFTACQEDDYEEIVGLCPVVLATNPDNLETAVALDETITVTFNTEMRGSTINTSTITLFGPDSIVGTVTYSDSIATFTPSVNLSPFTTYTGNVHTTVKDITGNALQVKYVWTFTTGAPGINLGSAERFGILSATGISNTGLSRINNSDIGVSPGLRTSITGFPPALILNGEMYAANDLVPIGIPEMLLHAHQDLTAGYFFAAGLTSPSINTLQGDLGGMTLSPGIYISTSASPIANGNLTLDAQGDANAFWVFQMASDFETGTGTGGDVVLIGGAQANNVFWQTAGTATIGSATSFKGTVLALSTIQMNSGATLEGRLLTRNGSIELTNAITINKPQ